jgi:hypothetical protein
LLGIHGFSYLFSYLNKKRKKNYIHTGDKIQGRVKLRDQTPEGSIPNFLKITSYLIVGECWNNGKKAIALFTPSLQHCIIPTDTCAGFLQKIGNAPTPEYRRL